MDVGHNELVDRYEGFLRSEKFGHVDRIATAIDDFAHHTRGDKRVAGYGCPRLSVSMAELRSHGDGSLSQQMRLNPLPHIRALEAACHSIATEERPGYDKEDIKMKVALSGPVGASPSCPRSLTSSSLRQLVCVEGVATKVSTVKPKVVKSVHYCPNTQKHQTRTYVDATDPQLGLKELDAEGRELPDKHINITNAVYPTKDADGNPLVTEFGLSEYKDHQTITLQEMPEKAPMGQLPRSVDLILDHDLVDKVKPGDRIVIVGVYRALAYQATKRPSANSTFRTVVLVNNVQILGRDASQLTFLPQDIRMIRSLAKRDDILSILGRSLAPSIYGHGVIKKALALQLLSGCEKNLENGTHLRGDINILMVGDPSTAKSQLLRSAMTIAPLAVSTTGKGSSGVGLTAAVTSDPDTRERRLEAGAMVLADRGLVCVDEFDKMGENDRVAIHEAMEQQTVTIAKAGIHASLNARCSVLAAANPVYGQYDRRRRIQENIGLPDSLLSRFDLLFVVLDQMDPECDRRIASHVITGHRYRPDHGQTGHDSDYDDDDSDEEWGDVGEESKVHSVWQRSRHASMHAANNPNNDGEETDPHAHDVLQHDFLRKYVHFAKTRVKPILTNGARDLIASRYAEMRCRQDERTLPITARSLETVIRLATAHAKVRLSNKVEAEPDCRAAMDILSFALYHENNDTVDGAAPTASPSKKRPQEVSEDEEGFVEDESSESTDPKRQRVSADSLQSIKTLLWEEISKEGDIALEDIGANFGDQDQVKAAIQALTDEGRIIVEDGTVFQIG
ncbi:licensing factor MCM3 [Seminavis robusta]|uniref:DNA replication licensing factor MCM3 n=1 Tax=Seminavis robusta TaxID=568900 RepID=A0A9N8DC72_9STRA|nr:licensing factor MCM3 [Seminavis robusta]|eukprot:Sro26_g017530.1 licensing factor MCM3 (792) ;mRNA; f:46053-48694